MVSTRFRFTGWATALSAAALLGWALGASAAGERRPASWSAGRAAAGTARVLGGPDQRIVLDLPPAVAERIQGPTFLVYFSPTCPHCQEAQAELNAVARAVAGRATFLGISSGAASQAAMTAFQREQKVAYPLLYDADRAIGAALQARSTPSVALVDREKKQVVLREAWYPYRQGGGTLLEMKVADQPFGPFTPGRYHSNVTCGACHVEEMGAWMLSHHSVAWETLVAKNADQRTDCNGCHVTGRDHGGWAPGQTPLVDVGCEACHGPGGPHDGVPQDARATCVSCHDAKHSIAFTVDKGLPHIDHFVASGLDDAAFTERYRALHTGQKARPLLAFQEGPHVGSKACAGCHPAEAAWWATDPHSRAMASLSGEVHEGQPASEQVTCVRCHTSPRIHGGPPPNRLDQLDVREGVGCESCHGPGGAHVAAGGGKENIEGLGEDCPVCVLEALCTSCHTAQWDPAWDLDTRLKQVQHGRP